MKGKWTARLLAWLLAFALLPLYACAGSTPLLYRVTNDAGHEIYLFGTIHVGNDALYPLPDQVLNAFDQSDVLAVEIDLLYEMENPAELLKYGMDIYYTDGGTAEAVLGADLVDAAADTLDMDRRLLNAMKPYGILSLLEEKSVADALLSTDLGADLFLLRRARETGKAVRALETVAEQYTLLHSMSDALYGYQIEMYARYPQQAALSTLMLLNAWKMGDRAALCRMLEADSDVSMLPESLAQEYLAFNEKMYGERDDRFTLLAEEMLLKGEKVFFAVGAAHVAGENGIADQLEEKGYTVEEIGH